MRAWCVAARAFATPVSRGSRAVCAAASACYRAPPGARRPVRAVIVAGSALLDTVTAALRVCAEERPASGNTPVVVLSGGIGHSTTLLYDAVASVPELASIATHGRSEAHVLADALSYFSRDSGLTLRVLIESASRNCGENASMSLALLRAETDMLAPSAGPSAVALVQDPTMLLRTHASVRRHMPEVDAPDAPVHVYAVTPFLAHVEVQDATAPGLFALRLVFVSSSEHAPPRNAVWTPARFVALLLGEVARIQDAPEGYGPRGKHFIAHVDVPEDVIAAGARVRAAFGEEVAGR